MIPPPDLGLLDSTGKDALILALIECLSARVEILEAKNAALRAENAATRNWGSSVLNPGYSRHFNAPVNCS